MRFWACGAIILSALWACSPPPNVERITIEPTQVGVGAPVYTATPSASPTPIPTNTQTATATVSPTVTPTASATLVPTDTATSAPTQTATPTTPPPPSATVALQALATQSIANAPAPIAVMGANTSASIGWSCGNFPCEDNIEAWQKRIQVPQGFALEFVANFEGQVNQITMGRDGLLYATVLENGTREGAVWRQEKNGELTRYSPTLISPLGLAFQPNTDVLYVSARTTSLQGGALWRIESNGNATLVLDNLPCCYSEVDNQPNGMIFGTDGFLYLGVGSLTDHAESPNPAQIAFANILPDEASILRVNPHTGEYSVFADGIRNPYDIALDSNGQYYATDSGLVTGIGDRILAISAGVNYGFPYYRSRGCEVCPPSRGNNFAPPDLLALPSYTLPRGIVAYNGAQFPQNFQNTLFVAFWNATDYGQKIVWIDPRDSALQNQTPETPYLPVPFVTGLLRPSDVVVDNEGSLLISDWLYGMVWRVRYTGEIATPTPTQTQQGFVVPTPITSPTDSPTDMSTTASIDITITATSAPVLGFATNTPSP